MISPLLKGLLREVAIAIIFITITVLTDNEDFAFSGMCFYLFYVLFETVYTVMQEKKRGLYNRNYNWIYPADCGTFSVFFIGRFPYLPLMKINFFIENNSLSLI